MPSPGVNIIHQTNAITSSTEETTSEQSEEQKDNTLENTLLGTGTGLVAVGGIGAGVVAHNNKKPKNVPTKEIDNTYDENKEKKDKNK